MEDAECPGPLPLGWAFLTEKQCSGLELNNAQNLGEQGFR